MNVLLFLRYANKDALAVKITHFINMNNTNTVYLCMTFIIFTLYIIYKLKLYQYSTSTFKMDINTQPV